MLRGFNNQIINTGVSSESRLLTSLLKNTVREGSIYFIANVVVAVTSFIIIPIFARIFVPEEYGLMSLVLSLVSIGSIITGNWLTGSVERFLSYYKRIKKPETFYSSLIFSMVLSLGTFYVLGISAYFLFKGIFNLGFQGLMPLAAIMIPLSMAFSIFLTIFRVKQQAKEYVIFQLSHKYIGLLVGLFLVICFHLGVPGILWGSIFSSLIFATLMFKRLFLVDNNLKFNALSFSTTKEFAFYGSPVMLSVLSSWILSVSDRYVIEFFRGTAEVGLYSMGYGIADGSINVLVTSFMLAVGPALLNTWESENREVTGKLLSQLTRYFIIIALPATVGVSVLSEPICKLLTTSVYYSSFVVIPFVAAGAFLYGLTLLSNTVLKIAKKTTIMARNYLLAGIANILLNMLLVPKFGFIAAAFTTTLSYAILLFLNILSTSQCLKWIVIPRSAFNSVLGSAVMAVAILFVLRFFSGPLIDCILGIGTGIIVYFGMLLLLNEFNYGELLEAKDFIKKTLPWLRN